ncbi:hypothetical protein [Tumidithrix helvetica]|uniref:hypothetical protein n=1 Tax=Tumidithrix helvetica TaxID=3457545 RepID=UPI003CC55609
MVVEISKLTATKGYRPQAIDTTIETDLLCFALLRQKTVQEHLQMGAQLNRSARKFAIAGFRRQFAHLSFTQFSRKLAEAWLPNCPSTYIPQGSEMTWIQDSIQLAGQLDSIFKQLSIPYYVTGGVAAIAYGEIRTTQDLDIVIEISTEQIVRLSDLLEQQGFYVAGLEQVITEQMKTLQITHIESISRADLIVAVRNDYEQLKFTRRQSYPLESGIEIDLASPEDLIVSKLSWQQSEKQLRDVLGILKIQADNLDFAYIYHWAKVFGLTEVVDRLCVEAGLKAIADSRQDLN